MFARDSFTTTYSGPVLASGESLGRAKSDAAAKRSFVGNERAYIPQMAGVRAGSKGSVYRAGLLGDSKANEAGDHYAAQLARMADDSQSRLDYSTGVAEEQEGLRRLLFDTDQTERYSQNASAKDNAFAYISSLQRDADRRMGRMSRGNEIFGVLGSILS
jgi:hypothetical protein